MYQFILLIHVFAAICIVAMVLVQQGKGAALGAGFGSGASQTVFGSRGSGSFLFRLTLGFVTLFFVTSIVLNYLATHAYKQEKVIVIPAAPAQQIPVKKAATPLTTLPAATIPVLPGEEIPVRK